MAIVAGVVFPYTALSLMPYGFSFLFVLMLLSGFSIDWRKLPTSLARPYELATGLFLLFVFFPLVQLLLAKLLQVDSQFLVGVVFAVTMITQGQRKIPVQYARRIVGRKEVIGRPFVYGTTRSFLEYFGLNSLDELPDVEEFVQTLQDREVAAITPLEEGELDNIQSNGEDHAPFDEMPIEAKIEKSETTELKEED